MTTQLKLVSPCHQATIGSSYGDGIMIGHCSECKTNVVRLNPRTGMQEWLNCNSPWTSENLEPLPDEYQNPSTLAFLPVFALRSPCHDQPIQIRSYMGQAKIGACDDCNNAFVRIDPESGRIMKLKSPFDILTTDTLEEVEEQFQPLPLLNV